jgi:hypothetical protein
MNADKREPTLAEEPWYFVGLDLGQSRDYSALAVVERADVLLDGMDYATYERHRERRYRVRFLERIALGTPYPEVVERARRVVRTKPLVGRCTLVTDATGVGGPVLDLLRRAQLGWDRTGGSDGRGDGVSSGFWFVPAPASAQLAWDLTCGFLWKMAPPIPSASTVRSLLAVVQSIASAYLELQLLP